MGAGGVYYWRRDWIRAEPTRAKRRRGIGDDGRFTVCLVAGSMGTEPIHLVVFGYTFDFKDGANPSSVWSKELRIRVGWRDNTVCYGILHQEPDSSQKLTRPECKNH